MQNPSGADPQHQEQVEELERGRDGHEESHTSASRARFRTNVLQACGEEDGRDGTVRRMYLCLANIPTAVTHPRGAHRARTKMVLLPTALTTMASRRPRSIVWQSRSSQRSGARAPIDSPCIHVGRPNGPCVGAPRPLLVRMVMPP
jgi:hypothetical protein